MSYEKGTYGGQPDEPVAEEYRRQLDQRALKQRI